MSCLRTDILKHLETCMGKQKHCWHPLGIALLSFPEKQIERCCFCGTTRSVMSSLSTLGHGPFHPMLHPQLSNEEKKDAGNDAVEQPRCT
jgi:hypothetical protein